MPDDIVIRRVRAEEWDRLRALRLSALADAPMAFGATLAAEQAFPDQVWQERAAAGAAGADRVTIIADAGGRWVGSVVGLLSAEGAGERPVWIAGMWVHPDSRRRGVAQALLRAVALWARERGADMLHLHVTEINTPAIMLYERLGFHASGETAPLAHTPTVREQHMQCPLTNFHGE